MFTRIFAKTAIFTFCFHLSIHVQGDVEEKSVHCLRTHLYRKITANRVQFFFGSLRWKGLKVHGCVNCQDKTCANDKLVLRDD